MNDPYRGELEQFDPYWLERMYAEWEEYEQYIEDDEPDTDCFFCGGTGLAGNGWDNCPECMGYEDES